MAIVDPILIEGLADFRRNLKVISRELPRAIRLAGNEAAQIVVDATRASMENRTGRAARSVRASSTQSRAQVTEGGARAPYVPWLDFGGRVGIRRSVNRPFVKAGRHMYPAYHAHRDDVSDVLLRALVTLADRAGVTTDGG